MNMKSINEWIYMPKNHYYNSNMKERVENNNHHHPLLHQNVVVNARRQV